MGVRKWKRGCAAVLTSVLVFTPSLSALAAIAETSGDIASGSVAAAEALEDRIPGFEGAEAASPSDAGEISGEDKETEADGTSSDSVELINDLGQESDGDPDYDPASGSDAVRNEGISDESYDVTDYDLASDSDAELINDLPEGEFSLTDTVAVTETAALAAGSEIVASGTCGDNVTWSLDADGLMTISGTGDMKNYSKSGYRPYYKYRSSVLEVVIEDGVTSIAKYAFDFFDSLTDISIADSVTTVGDYAFEYCTSLGAVDFPDSVTSIGNYAFYGCTSLVEVMLPDSITEIADYSFRYCESLAEITIPAGVTDIGKYAFDYCTGLADVAIPDSVVTINYNAFQHCSSLSEIIIPDSVTGIGAHSFEDCTGLTDVTLPEGLEDIGQYSFEGCTGLTDITIPGTVKTFNFAFKDCTGLARVTISDSVTEISGGAFYNCTGLFRVSIPDSVTMIGASAFFNCISLTSLTFPGEVAVIGDQAFDFCSALTEVGSLQSVIWVGDAAFRYCTGLTEIILSDAVCYIGEEAFRGCTSIADISYAESGGDLTDISYSEVLAEAGISEDDYEWDIGTEAFRGCLGLTSFTVPVLACALGDRIFEECANLVKVTFQGNAFSQISDETFSGVTATVYYPADDSTWTEEIMLDYGGELTWVSGGKETDISNAIVTLSASSYTYNGSAKKPVVTVVLDGETLTKSSDYTVVYSDNIEVGTATVTVSGIGSYTGTVETTFTISKGSQVVTASAADTLLYIGEMTAITATTTGDGAVTYQSSDSSVAAVDASTGQVTAVGAGTAVITVSAAETDHYETGKTTLAVAVASRSLSNASISLSSGKYTYSGSACTPTVTVIINGTVLTNGTDYAVSYFDNVNAGAAIVSVTGIGNYTGSAVTTFTILQDSQVVSMSVPDTSMEIGDTMMVTASTTGDGAITFRSSDTSVLTVNSTTGKVTAVGAGRASITATAAETTNFTFAAAGASIEVKSVAPVISSVENTSTGIRVSWGATDDSTTYYVYRRALGESEYTRVKATSHTYYNDTDVTSGVTYLYKVKTSGSSLSASKGYKWLERPTVADIANTSSAITLSWDSVDGAARYYVYRKAAGESSYTRTKTTTKTSYTDTTVSGGTTYSYRVEAVNGSYVSYVSATKSLRRLERAAIQSISNTSSALKVTWSSVSGANQYYVYRKASGESSYTNVKTTTSLSYSDTTAENGVTYTYRIVAGYGSYLSAAGATKSYKRMERVTLSAPTNSGAGKMTVSWTKNAKATYYQIQYSTSSSFGSYTSVKASSSKVSKVISGLTKGKTYYVRVRPYYQSGSGTNYYAAWSAVKSVKISK